MRRAIRAILTAVIGAGLVPATAATNAFAASGATAPPGYQRVRSAPIPIPPGMFDSGGEVACPAGTVPWGGGIGFTGGIPSVGENINTSAPTGNGWRGRYTNSGTQTSDNFAIDAICANQPAGYTTTFRTVDNPAGAQSAVTAACPAGTRLFSGGTLSTAEAISVVNSGLAMAGYYGDGQLHAGDLAAGLTGAVVKDPVQDRVVWLEYLQTVVKERDGWKDLYRACQEVL